jgi:predicted NBD/HSP70 family sugar kinase
MTQGTSIRNRAGKGADTSALREHNLALVLADVRDHQPTLRSEVAARTGLARGSLTTIVPELIGSGLVRESRASSESRGRPSAPLEIDGSRFAVVAIHITGTDITTESVDLGSRAILVDRRQHGAPQDPEVLVDLAAQMMTDQLAEFERRSIAFVKAIVVIAAPVIGSPATVMWSTDLAWGAVDLTTLLEARLPVLAGRTSLVNDAAMAALAEHRALYASGASAENIIYVKSDTGIGGGAVANGELLLGAHGIAFEPGHIVVRRDGNPCHCGRRGCLVAEIGPHAVIEAAGLEGYRESGGIGAAVAELVRRAHEQDPRSLEVLAEVGAVLRSTVEDLSRLFDPDRVIIGGYWVDVFDELGLGHPLTEELPSLAAARRAGTRGGSFVVPGRLGSRAPRAGALVSALDDLFGDPHLIPRIHDLN